MNVLLQGWSGYVRLTQRWPGLAAIVPFIPVVAQWTAVTEAGVFPRAFLPGPLDVVRSFVTLTYKGILPDYLQDSLIRLFTGAALGMALGIPLGIRAHRREQHGPHPAERRLHRLRRDDSPRAPRRSARDR